MSKFKKGDEVIRARNSYMNMRKGDTDIIIDIEVTLRSRSQSS